ncbi:MAG: glycine cleavage system aminomethyltransferase GcvT [Treponema sp.]|jgi:glycine cleavage system T protein|nr:glycine cleavage system aminomethyltransferase GcvT [Treponema sp.]
MKTTLLRPWHEAAGARFAPFAGFDMPIQYPAGAVGEHRLCRRSAGLFDIDHMGRFLVFGEGAGKALSAQVSGAVLDMGAGEARYSLLLNEAGGIVDDLFIYRLGEGGGRRDLWLVVVNAGNRETDYAWFRERLPRAVSLEDLSGETYMIALQGPRAVELLDRLASPGGQEVLPGGAPGAALVSAIPRARMGALTLAGIPVLAGRTGYTGEDGAELFYGASQARVLWEALLTEAAAAGIEAGPVGLAARDSLRFEAGMPLHGHEISPSISPLEALLSWACDFTKDFTGKEALAAQKAAGLKRKLATLNVTGGVPREGYRVLTPAGEETGVVAAGMFCPTVGTYSANAFVPPERAVPGTRLAVEIRGNAKEAVVVKRPLYTPVYRRAGK